MIKPISALVFLSVIWIAGRSTQLELWNEETPLQEVLHQLGENYPGHYLQPDSTLVNMGEELVKLGRTIGPDGKRTSYISKYYVCTTCHNLEIEDPDLRVSDPEARLPFVKVMGLPFLQGTTFKGIVNRESWHNGDYGKKYGDEKIERAHKNLRAAIQLCSIECSQGRPLEGWEIEAVLGYLWTLQFDLGDLGLTASDFEKLNSGRNDPAQVEELRTFVRSFYSTKPPAHFCNAPKDKRAGCNGLVGNPAIGKDIYELSCLHCHQPNGVSHYILDNSELSFRHLDRMMKEDSHFSLYQIIAYGTHTVPGHEPHMPHFPLERMSMQQVEDLRAYIEQMAR